MKRVLNVRLFIAAVTLAVALVGLFAALPETQAFVGVCTYYNNAKHQQVVGQRGTGCCGESVNWGIVTAYRTCGQIYCLDIWCPPPTE